MTWPDCHRIPKNRRTIYIQFRPRRVCPDADIAAVFLQGKFYAESLIMAETGNSIGAIQIAGTGSPSQIPFFVTACDYTLIGEEFFAASAYLGDDPKLLGSIKGQDIVKAILMACLGLGVLFETFNLHFFKNLFAGS